MPLRNVIEFDCTDSGILRLAVRNDREGSGVEIELTGERAVTTVTLAFADLADLREWFEAAELQLQAEQVEQGGEE